MRAVGRACDVCERFTPSEKTPDEWFSVKRGKLEPVEACSPACLCKLGRQLAELDASAPAGGAHKCGRCKREFATKQGLGLHKTRVHG